MGLKIQCNTLVHPIFCPNVARLNKIETLRHIIIEGFRGGSDEKMRRMWLGQEIVVTGLPPLVS